MNETRATCFVVDDHASVSKSLTSLLTSLGYRVETFDGADALGIAEQTVKIHPGRIKKKLEVVSIAELVRLAEKTGIAPAP